MGKPRTDRTAILQLIQTLKKAGWNAVKISDPESVIVKGMNPTEIADLITSHYDIALLDFNKPEVDHHRNQWVYFVMGNAPEEVVFDHTVGNQELSPKSQKAGTANHG